MIEHDEPATYGGDAPHVDVPTSISAANEAFSKLVKRQRLVLISTGQRREKGYTVKEFRDKEKFHHGTASSLFTTLHMRGLLVALQEVRNGATVYVLPEYVNGRETRPYRRQNQPLSVDEIADVLQAHHLAGWENECTCGWLGENRAQQERHVAETLAAALRGES